MCGPRDMVYAVSGRLPLLCVEGKGMKKMREEKTEKCREWRTAGRNRVGMPASYRTCKKGKPLSASANTRSPDGAIFQIE